MKPKLYTIKKIDSEEGKVSVEPTEFLQKLGPRKAIEAMREHCAWLVFELRKATGADVETPEIFKKTTRLLSELDVAQKFLIFLQEDYVAKVGRNRLK